MKQLVFLMFLLFSCPLELGHLISIGSLEYRLFGTVKAQWRAQQEWVWGPLIRLGYSIVLFRFNFFQVGCRHFLPQPNGSFGSEVIALRKQMGSFYSREIGDRFGAFHQAIVYDRNLSSRDGDPNGAPLAIICL